MSHVVLFAIDLINDVQKSYSSAITGVNDNIWKKLKFKKNWFSRKMVGTKWVLNIKHDSIGSVKKYKVRLVIQGFS